MNQCLQCQSVVPVSLVSCPNCAIDRKRGSKVLMAAAGLVALVSSNCSTIMPVYGIPCTSKQLDGGNNGCPGECSTLLPDGGSPTRDPADSCFKADGGTP